MSRIPNENRKSIPLWSGVFDFFPEALVEVSKVSVAGALQRDRSELFFDESVTVPEHADALMRHLADCGAHDHDGVMHSAKVAWRALALLQREINEEREINGSATTN